MGHPTARITNPANLPGQSTSWIDCLGLVDEAHTNNLGTEPNYSAFAESVESVDLTAIDES